jgi:hypothetical protein
MRFSTIAIIENLRGGKRLKTGSTRWSDEELGVGSGRRWGFELSVIKTSIYNKH